MTLTTKNLNDVKMTIRKKVQNLFKTHKLLIKTSEHALVPKFIPSPLILHNEQNCIMLGDKEMYGGKDIYIEFCTSGLLPLDDKRHLWKWLYKKSYKNDYTCDKNVETQECTYFIPVDELIPIGFTPEIIAEMATPKPIVEFNFEGSAGEDIPFNDMTLKDYAAIKWKRPVSGRKWLNDLINNNFKSTQ